jgi:hypothetical protein
MISIFQKLKKQHTKTPPRAGQRIRTGMSRRRHLFCYQAQCWIEKGFLLYDVLHCHKSLVFIVAIFIIFLIQLRILRRAFADALGDAREFSPRRRRRDGLDVDPMLPVVAKIENVSKDAAGFQF